MDKIVIQGGRKLKGTVEISGAKNAALPRSPLDCHSKVIELIISK